MFFPSADDNNRCTSDISKGAWTLRFPDFGEIISSAADCIASFGVAPAADGKAGPLCV